MNISADQQFIEGMPDLVMSLSRDGTIKSHGGGRSMRHLMLPPASSGRALDSVWPLAAAQVVRHLIRKAIAARGPLESTFTEQGQDYRARVTPEGPDRALCVVRPEMPVTPHDAASSSGTYARPYLERRGFLRQFQELVDKQTLLEQPMALIAILLSGVDEIARIDARTAETVVSTALMRLAQAGSAVELALCAGQFSESQLLFALGSLDRQHIERFCGEVLHSLAVPVQLGLEQYALSGCAGVALLGRDASSSQELLNCARMAAAEARRSSVLRPRFFSDTMKLSTRSRLDVSAELREAIAARTIQTRCVGRHDLESGELVAVVAYAKWSHPLRGIIPPGEFLNIADVTGESLALSRALLRSVGVQAEGLAPRLKDHVRFSFGPLRRHLLHADFLTDLKAFFKRCPIVANRFEVRVAESVFVSLPLGVCLGIEALGAQIIVDEAARGSGSLDRLARAPLSGLQIDRAWISALGADEVARRVCQASIAAAHALRITPIAVGVDTELHRHTLLNLGCPVGSGDLFGNIVTPGDKPLLSVTRTRRSGDRKK